jgi:hypothetical protein
MGLDWLLIEDEETVDTFRGKGISTLANIPDSIRDLCFGDESSRMTQIGSSQIIAFLTTLLDSNNPEDFQYEGDEIPDEKDIQETKSFLRDAISFLEQCDFKISHIYCWC